MELSANQQEREFEVWMRARLVAYWGTMENKVSTLTSGAPITRIQCNLLDGYVRLLCVSRTVDGLTPYRFSDRVKDFLVVVAQKSASLSLRGHEFGFTVERPEDSWN